MSLLRTIVNFLLQTTQQNQYLADTKLYGLFTGMCTITMSFKMFKM